MAIICKWDHLTNPNYKEVLNEVKEVLGDRYNYKLARGIAEKYSGTIDDITPDYILQQWPKPEASEEKNLSSQPEDTNITSPIQAYSGDWSRNEVAKPENQDKLFIFTDNTDRNSGRELISDDSKYAKKYGKGKHYPKKATSAVIRGLDNAMPVSTQRWYHGEFKREKGRWTNADAEEFRKVIHQEIDDIIEEWNTGNYTQIILPNGGLFTESGITGINDKERSEIKKILEDEVKRLYAAVGMPFSAEVQTAPKTEEQQKLEDKIQARTKAKQARQKVSRWDQFAHGRKVFEVSSAGNELGRQFSALAAVFPEGTTIKIKGKKKGQEWTFDIGGYSIEAAYQLIKGYNGNPKGSLIDKNGNLIAKIQGKGKAPISDALRIKMSNKPTSADKKAAEEYSYMNAYLPLWKLWKSLNPELFNQLKKEVRKQKIEVLTDKFADHAVSQARALSELLWGAPKTHVTEKVQTQYDIQRQNAIEASKQIPKDVKKIKNFPSVKVRSREGKSDQQIANMVNAVTSTGQKTTNKPMILSYKLEDEKAMSEVIHDFSNPFEGQANAVAKFIQWIMPNDFRSLPDELRIEENKRNVIRTYLAKGGYTKTDILANENPENVRFAETLRYIIDNFQELRLRYNPVDINEFAQLKQKVRVQAAQGEQIGANNITYFAPLEQAPDGTVLDDSNAIKLERQTDGEGASTNNIIISFPADYGKKFSRVQKQRLFKTIAMSLRENEVLILDPDVATDEMINDFNNIVSRGFKQVGEKSVTFEDGSQQTIGIFRRNGFRKPQVETHEPFVIKTDVSEVFSQLNQEYEKGKLYMVEMGEDAAKDYSDRELWENFAVIPIYTTHSGDWTQQSRWSDNQFDAFKTLVDRAFDYMNQKIDEGFTVVIPTGDIGSGRAALQNYAPKCYEYLQQKIQELKEHGNRDALANQYFAEAVTTVEAVDVTPAEAIQLDPKALQSPRALLRQRFTDRQLSDLSKLFAKQFIAATEKINGEIIEEINQQLVKTNDKDEEAKLKRRLNRLTDPISYLIATLDEVGVEGVLERVKKGVRATSNLYAKTQEQKQVFLDSISDDFSPFIFSYAIPLIENYSGIRIKQTQLTATQSQTTEEKNDAAEDTAGEDSPEMGWSYNHRLVDPSKSLSKSIRSIISDISIRDLNSESPNAFQKNSLGLVATYEPSYIYSAIMSRMSQMSLGEIDNFMTITPVEKLSGSERDNYPLGKPVFPVLESMKTRYPWANDIISQLSRAYRVGGNGAKGYNKHRFGKLDPQEVVNNPITIAEVGNICSQFHSNFCQQFVHYATMVNGAIIDENKPTGSVSMRKAAIANYNGNIRFPGIDMLYNADGSINFDNLQKALDKLSNVYDTIQEEIKGKNRGDKAIRPFWDAVKKVKEKTESGSIIDMFQALPDNVKKPIRDLSDILKSAGIDFPAFDIWGIIYEGKNPGITEMMGELTSALNSLAGLPAGEHMFESSYNLARGITQAGKGDYYKYDSPKTAWNHFFDKFGDYVNDQELEASPRILDKTRYSYTYPSYMSVTIANLTQGSSKDSEGYAARKKYIEENFMPYEWFYDKKKKKFKNTILENLYNNPDSVALADGHDMLAIKQGYSTKEYSEWTPEDISRLMFRELVYSNDARIGNFIIPVLSDSRICKVIQAHKDMRGAMDSMVSTILQELERIAMVEKRNVILRMQDIEEKMSLKASLSEEEKKYYNSNIVFYQNYQKQHPERLEEIENFDKNGTKFCFFPELNKYMFSMRKAERNEDGFMRKIVLLLSRDPNNPSQKEVSFKDVLRAIQNMSDENFNRKARLVGLSERKYGDYIDADGNAQFGEYYTAATKEYIIQRIVEETLTQVLNDKVHDFFYDRWGSVNESVRSGILHADADLMSRWNKRPVASENHPLTPEEEEELRLLNLAIYNRARDFYFAHTGAMTQFLQLMVTDLAYYKDPSTFMGSVDFAKRFKEVYGAGMKMNTNSKFGKKIERNIILKDKVRRSSSWKTLERVLDKAVEEGRILDVEKEAVLEKFKRIKGTDAQAFRSLTSWRDIMDMVGRNSYELAEAIDNLRNGRFTMSDFYTVFNTIKPFTYGPEDMDSGVDDIHLRTMVQHKNSEAVLLAIYSTLVGSSEEDANYSPTIRGLNRAMEEIELVSEDGKVMTYANGEHMKAIDVAQYQSAVKVGAQGVIDINYSRNRLNEKLQEAAKNNGKITVGGVELSGIKPDTTYYNIEKKLSKLLDSNKITFEQYEKAMDFFEPTEQEVFDIIKQSIYINGDESLGYNDQVLHKIPYKYYCIQQPTPNHYTDNEEATFGSQPRHIILSDLPADFKITINGKTYNRDQIRERYNSLIVANLLDCYEKEIEPLFKDTGEVNKEGKRKTTLEKLRDRLMPIIESNPKYGKQLSDALEIVPDGKGGETFALPLNNLVIAQMLEEVMTSLFKNAIHRQTINGGNVILAADVGYSKKLKIRGERDKEGKLIPGKIEGIECYLPASSRKMLKPYMVEAGKDKDGNTIYKLDPQKLKEAGLDKCIGYRIPTEGPYSIMPLIIMGFLPQQSGSSIVVAQEVVTLTGSDNDVDKMFLMLKAFSDKNLKAIKSGKEGEELHPLSMTKLQRDNEIIDIFYGIVTHPQMSHRWLHPGNFDNIIVAAKRNRIIKSNKLRTAFMQKAGLANTDQLITALSEELKPSQYNELYRRVMELPADTTFEDDKTLMDIVVDFTDKYIEPLSPVYPDTFTKMHQIYMAGVAEKGIFANNRLDNAKLQWANVTIAPTHTFNFEGREVKRLDDITVTRKRGGKTYQHYISDDCAECSAAAVDNGKTPTLGDLNSNTQTATFFGFLTRLGLGIDGATLLLSQPAVDRSINNSGGIDVRTLKKDQKKIAAWLKDKGYDLQDDRFNWRIHNFNTREWYKNIIDGHNLSDLLNQGGKEEVVERMASLYRTYDLIRNLITMNSEMQDPRTILHYDSPNHAADTAMGGVIEQTKVVQEVNSRKDLPEFDRTLRGDDQLVVYKVEERYNKNKKQKEKKKGGIEVLQKTSPKYQLYDAIMSTEMPITQAFYTLGIEKIRTEMATQFVFGREEIQRLTDRLYQYMKDMNIKKPSDRRKIISQAYRDWVVFRLSGTKMFGDDDTMTFDQKRQYYLYQFPEKFMELKKQIPELQQLDATRRMFVDRSGGKTIIKLNRESDTPLTVRDFLSDSFDTLLQSKDKQVQQVAKDLLMYTYYLNGFEFSYMSFGNFIGTEFQRAFPEYIQALIDLNTEVISDEMLDNFFDQFIVKNNKKGLLPQITYENNSDRNEAAQKGYHNTGRSIEWYGGIEEVPQYVTNVSIVGNKTKTEILKYNHELTQLYGTVIYVPLRMNTSLHYNANQTMEEMGDVVYDQDLIDANWRFGKKNRSKEFKQYDEHKATNSHRESSNSREENSDEPIGSPLPKMAPEDSSLDSTQAAAAFKDGNDEYEDNKDALGRMASEDPSFTAEKNLEEYDAMAPRTREQPEDSNDPDLEDAQSIIKENNDGKGLCV